MNKKKKKKKLAAIQLESKVPIDIPVVSQRYTENSLDKTKIERSSSCDKRE